jgi:cytoskeleton protein RodZ
MAMSELGAFLQRHREDRGLTLDEVEELTRIRRAYIEAIEAGDWGALPPGVYTRGLLRNYARALDVSQASVMRMYVKERPQEARLPEPQLISRPLVNEPRISLEFILAVVIMGVAVVMMLWIAQNYVLPAVRNAGGEMEGTPPAASTVSAAVPGATSGTPGRPTRAAGQAGAATSTRTPQTRPATVRSATRTPTARPTAPAGLAVEIKATGNAWLRILSDGEPAFEGFLREGDAWQGQAKERVRIRMGNAGVTEVTLNGQPVGPLGKPGDVVEHEWRLGPDGNIVQIDQPQ